MTSQLVAAGLMMLACAGYAAGPLAEGAQRLARTAMLAGLIFSADAIEGQSNLLLAVAAYLVVMMVVVGWWLGSSRYDVALALPAALCALLAGLVQPAAVLAMYWLALPSALVLGFSTALGLHLFRQSKAPSRPIPPAKHPSRQAPLL